MITLKPLFRAENMKGLYKKVIKGQFSKIPNKFSNDLFIIIKLLLEVNLEDIPAVMKFIKLTIILI